MPIQTAPASITVAVTGGNTVYTLVDKTDNSVTYRAATVAGTVIPANELVRMPVLTFSRRPRNSQNDTVKYYFKHTVKSLDVTGNVLATHIDSGEIVNPLKFELTGPSVRELTRGCYLAMGNSVILDAISDGSFFS